jgi:hypothetical protein
VTRPKDFAFVPDEGPPRLIRYVEHGSLPDGDLVSIFDATNNLLIVDREHFDRLDKPEQEQVLRTREPHLLIQELTWTDWPETKQAAE